MKNCNLVLYISALACKLAEGRTTNEINWLSAFFTQLGAALDTISSQEELCAAPAKTNEDSSE